MIKHNLKKLILILLACYGLNANAQVDESRNFIYFYSDSVIYAENVRLRTDFFDAFQLRADSKRIPLQQVKFFNNDEGFFANTRKLNATGQVRLSVRTEEGRINLFEERSFNTFYNGRHTHHEGRVDIRTFYNKGYDDLKKVKYKNLKIDMVGHTESLDLLEDYRKNTNISKALYAAGVASAAAALISFLVKAKDNQKIPTGGGFNGQMPEMNRTRTNFTTSFVLLGVSAGFAIGGYSVSLSGIRKLEDAIDAYNR